MSPESAGGKMRCLVCGATATVRCSLSADMLRDAYAKDVGKVPFTSVAWWDIIESTCDSCGLGFTEPMRGGSPEFYAWITEDGARYANSRWEFGVLHDILAKQLRPGTMGIDIGCGNGAFIARLRGIHGVHFKGIDTNGAAVAQGIKCGLDVSLDSVDQVLARGERFDVVTAFHCLEHVENPVGFVEAALNLLKPGGSVFFSVPVSPTTLELSAFDPRNHAPHHLTRWTAPSLKSLGARLSVEIEFLWPPLPRSFVRAAQALAFKHCDRRMTFDRRTQISSILRHPFEYFQIWKQLRNMAKSSSPLRDLVLCRARVPSTPGDSSLSTDTGGENT